MSNQYNATLNIKANSRSVSDHPVVGGLSFSRASSDDDVNGQVVGDVMLVGQLCYQDRPQGQRLYANSEQELRQLAFDKKHEFIEENPMVYQTDQWTRKIFQ